MPKHSFILLSILLSCSHLAASNDSIAVYQGCSGGMLLHTGGLFGRDANAPRDANGVLCSPQGATFGIGGAMRVNLWKHLRLGGEGFVSTMYSTTTDCATLLKKGSFIRSGWGGLLVDACWRDNKVWPYVGSSMGGGATRAFYLLEGNQYDWETETNAVYHKQTFFYVCPFVGLDWCMTTKVHMTFRADWVAAIHQSSLVLPSGPRLHIGFMFCH